MQHLKQYREILILIYSSFDNDSIFRVLKSGSGDPPQRGEIVGIRFLGSYQGNVFDDTFKSEQPYLFRVGVGSVVKGLDETVLQMKLGQKIKVSFSGEYSFPNGKPSSPGKPRIPPGAQ